MRFFARITARALPLTLGLALGTSAVEASIPSRPGLRTLPPASLNLSENPRYLAELPFGEECTAGPCASNPGVTGGQPKHFTGKERDTETGLDYFGARYYRGNLGRFTSVDPTVTMKENIVDPQRWNRYAYGRNNPLRFVDPNGRDWIEYSGEQVTWYGGSTGDRSQPSGSYPASSGLPGHQT